MLKKTKDFWNWTIDAIDSKGNVIDIDDEFCQDYGMLCEEIDNAVGELRKKHCKHTKAKIKK